MYKKDNNVISRTIGGGVIMGLAVVFLIGGLQERTDENKIIWVVVSSLVFLLGLYIFLNTKEDHIEQIKSKK